MSRKLPILSGADMIRVLQKFGYEVIRQPRTSSECFSNRAAARHRSSS